MKLGIVLMIWLAIFGVRLNSNFQAEGKLRAMEGKQIQVVGRVSSEPLLQGTSQRFKIGKIEMRTKQYPKFEYGDTVTVSGSLQRRMINKWYSRFSLMYPDVKLVDERSAKVMGFRWKEKIYTLRRQIEGVYNRNIPEPEASLLAGIVLGAKRSLDAEFYTALQKTSTLHIVVASGYNVTVVIGAVIFMLAGFLKRKWAVFWSVVAVFGYTIMAGGEPAIVRAAIMGSLAYFGQVLGRQNDGMRLLLVAVMVMLTWQPMLVWDIGFQLSVAATLGLILISPLLKRVFGIIWGVGNDIAETTSAQLAVWPILVISFGNMSLFGILVNSLILWLVPIIMALGAGLAAVGLVFEPLGRVIGWLVYVPLTMMVRIIDWFGEQAWISLKVEGLDWKWGLGYYLVLVIIIYWFRTRKPIVSLGSEPRVKHVEVDK